MSAPSNADWAFDDGKPGAAPPAGASANAAHGDWTFDDQTPPAIGGRFGNDPLVGLADAGIAGANQFVVGGLGAAARTVNRLLPEGLVGGDGSKQAMEDHFNAVQDRFTYHPQTAAGQRLAGAVSGLLQPVANTVGSAVGAVVGNENTPAVMDALATMGFRGPSQVLSMAARTVVPGLAEAAQSLSEARAIDQAATAAGQGTLGLRTGSPLANFIEKQSARLWGGSPLADAAQASNDQLGITARDIVNNLSQGADTSSQGVGSVLTQQLKTAAERLRDQSHEGFEKVAALLPDNATVPVARTQGLLQSLTDIPGASATAETVVPGDIRALASALSKDAGQDGVLPYDALRALRSNIGQTIDWNPFVSTPTNGLYKRIYSAMGRDLDEGAAGFGDDVASQIKANNAAYARTSATRDTLSSLVNRAGGPEKVYNAIFNTTKDGDTTLNTVLSNVDLPTRQLLAASALERMGRALPGAQSAAGDVFSADRFLSNWSRMSPQARASLFTTLPGDYANSIDQLVANAGKLKAYGNVLRGHSAFSSLGSVGAIAEVMAHGLPGFGHIAALVGANRALALALTNPSAAGYLARASAEAAGTGASYLGRVYGPGTGPFGAPGAPSAPQGPSTF
jgi:hypothetical protein